MNGSIPTQMNSFYGGEAMIQAGGERVRVAMRVRPMMPHELNRADENIITIPDNSHVLLSLKSGTKSFRFNAVLGDSVR
jgi:hypothetical protein